VGIGWLVLTDEPEGGILSGRAGAEQLNRRVVAHNNQSGGIAERDECGRDHEYHRKSVRDADTGDVRV